MANYEPDHDEETHFPSGFPRLSATDAEEVRSYNEKTGAEKGVKLARYDLIPIDPLRILAEHYGKGAAKYAERNWELGIDWSKLYAAAMRHLTQFWAGEDTDPETGTPHVISAAWMCFALCQMMIEHPELDDRPSVSRQRDRADGQHNELTRMRTALYGQAQVVEE